MLLGNVDFSNLFAVLKEGATAAAPYASLAEAKKAGAVIAYGNFITIAINFSILALIIFMLVKQMNKLKKEAPPAAPAPTPEDVMILREIRDALKK